ncbi:dnaJ homolog subfamily C member 4-like [Littorina saxatilis]|uniref:J domain-containing protein n=1 Tax=Littorina saxatilis TaxID=31220 RepID=A0AAN9BD09_9CAEN
MLGPLLAQALASGRLACPHCRSCLLAVGLRYASQSHYDTLGLHKSASQADIRHAFLSLSKQLHPDINSQDPKNHDKFVNLNEAYTVLSKPIARREYDLNLAVRLQMQWHARNASTSHVHGSSPWPGSNAGQQYQGDQQKFWDETLFHMRDQSKDKEYEDRPYYGIKNLKKMSNMDIVLGCFALMTAGALLHYFAISKSTQMHKNVLDEKDKKYHSNLVKARANAKAHGNALQLQILQSKVTKTPLEGVSEETMRDAFRDVQK